MRQVNYSAQGVPRKVSRTGLGNLDSVTLLTLLEFTFMSRFGIVHRIRRMIVFGIVGQLLTAVAGRRHTHDQTLHGEDEGGHIIAILTVTLETQTPHLSTNISMRTLTERAVHPGPTSRERQFIGTDCACIFGILNAHTARGEYLGTVETDPRAYHQHHHKGRGLLKVVQRDGTATTFGVCSMKIRANIVLGEAGVTIRRVTSLKQCHLNDHNKVI